LYEKYEHNTEIT